MIQYDQPLLLHRDSVRTEWVDEYDHMNLAYYVAICDWGTSKFWELANNGQNIDERGGMEYAVVETHVNYIREVRLADELIVSTQLLSYDEKRFHLFHTLKHAKEGFVSATNEVMSLGFSLNERGIQPFRTEVQRKLAEIFKGQSELPVPTNAGRAISLRPKSL